MAYTLMDGKAVANRLKEEIRSKVEKFARKPKLISLLMGDDPAVKTYVNSKRRISTEIGVNFESFNFPLSLSEEDLREKILGFSKDKEIDGIILELPLPVNYNLEVLTGAIEPNKDVDCVNPVNLGLLVIGKPYFFPSTPLSIMRLLSEYSIKVAGKRAVVIGRSLIVGRPISFMLLAENATVTMCHSKTEDLPQITKEADILISAIGKPEMIDSSFVKEGAVVIDVGINFVNGEIVGDVKFDEVSKVSSHITPVPGGVGALTTIMLLRNTVEAYKMHT